MEASQSRANGFLGNVLKGKQTDVVRWCVGLMFLKLSEALVAMFHCEPRQDGKISFSIGPNGPSNMVSCKCFLVSLCGQEELIHKSQRATNVTMLLCPPTPAPHVDLDLPIFSALADSEQTPLLSSSCIAHPQRLGREAGSHATRLCCWTKIQLGCVPRLVEVLLAKNRHSGQAQQIRDGSATLATMMSCQARDR